MFYILQDYLTSEKANSQVKTNFVRGACGSGVQQIGGLIY